MPEVKSPPPHIYEAMAALMDKVKNVPKDGQAPAAAGGYKFRGVEQLTQVVGDAARSVEIMLQSEIHTVPQVAQAPVTANGKTLIWTSVHLVMTYHFTSLRDGSKLTFEAAGEGRDNSDKATAKAMSVALKYALGQALLIGTGDEDPDAERPGIASERPPQGQEPIPESQRTVQAAAALKAAGEPGMTRERLTAIWTRADSLRVLDIPLVDSSGTLSLRERLTAIGNTLAPAAQEPPEEQEPF